MLCPETLKPQGMPSEWELDNLLVGQKDAIIAYIDNGVDQMSIQRMLAVVKPLWVACNYLYKYNELCNRLIQRGY